LAFYGDRDEPLSELIGRRLSDLRLPDCSSYVRFLADGENGRAEMDLLVSQLTIGETYFFRHAEQFAAIREIVLPEILARKQSSRQLRIWSAGCATGAEPYSLAIMIADEFADRIAGWQVVIYATDLNRSYLARATEGKFRESALRSTSDEMRRACFSNEGSNWTIHPRYKKWISFHQMNLVESEFSTSFDVRTDFDLILCRNVMIYFAPEECRKLVGKLYKSLGDEGWLLVGASEHNPDNYRSFRTVNTAGARLYQKTSPPRVRMAPEPILLRPVAAPEPILLRPVTATKVSGEPLIEAPAEPERAGMEHLRGLADRGEWQNAVEYGQGLLVQDRLNPSIHFYQALILDKLGFLDQSERSFRQAIYLNRGFALAHYHLGLALKRDRQMPAAYRSFGNVLRVLAGVADQSMVPDGPGITVKGLKELAKMHLRGLGES
jgi:chemotaxis protein methyltransferase CheR